MRRVRPFSLSRRTVLRGLGASLALPWLEIMDNKRAAAPQRCAARVLFIYFPTGYRKATWLATRRPAPTRTISYRPLLRRSTRSRASSRSSRV